MSKQNNHTSSIHVPISLKDPACLPKYMTEGAAGADLCAHLMEPLVILPGRSALVPTGIHVAIPQGYEMQVRPRSGLALKHQLTVLNTPGTIDADYRGEVQVILINHGNQPFTVDPGLRIAQLVLTPVLQAHFSVQNALDETTRGSGGFGHTGHVKP